MKHNADEERAETARLSSFVGAMAIGDLVKSTLGPKGMDKILMSMGGPSNVGKCPATISYLVMPEVFIMYDDNINLDFLRGKNFHSSNLNGQCPNL